MPREKPLGAEGVCSNLLLQIEEGYVLNLRLSDNL